MTPNKKLDLTLLISRVLLGIIILGHGTQKLFGWFGGYGFDGTMEFFTDTIGLPYIFGFLIILAESAGMIALILGLLGRFISASLIVIMAGAIITMHGQFGFFMNWGSHQGGEGYEFHLLVIALSLITVINGSGAYSLDRFLFSKKNESPEQPTYA